MEDSEQLYRSLPDATKYIRLLRIEAHEAGNTISCTLATFSIAGKPQHVAISYTWGSAVSSRIILIDGMHVEVRQNCFPSLKQACYHGLSTWCWIDALCINQEDVSLDTAVRAFVGTNELMTAAG